MAALQYGSNKSEIARRYVSAGQEFATTSHDVPSSAIPQRP
jgi:hypothetical protein